MEYALTEKYKNIFSSYSSLGDEKAAFEFSQDLIDLWVDEYIKHMNTQTEIMIIPYNKFEFVFDDCDSIEGCDVESRVIAVIGRSAVQSLKRDDTRLKGWLGSTENIFGSEWDKGHFIGHALGGAVDGVEMNVYQQRRDLNRGWSERGKVFVQMETYCIENPDTLCFNRPIYLDRSHKPSYFEYGLIKKDNSFWVEIFDNR